MKENGEGALTELDILSISIYMTCNFKAMFASLCDHQTSSQGMSLTSLAVTF